MRALCFALLLAGLSCAAQSAENAKPAEARAPFYLLVDHLSPVLYDGEPMTACFRVENATAKEDSVEVTVALVDAGDAVLSEDRRKITVPASGQTSCRFDLDIKGVRVVRFAMVSPAGTVEGPQVRILRVDDAWPKTKVVDGHVTDADTGQVILPVVMRRERKEERSFSSLSWLVPGEGGKEPAPTGVLLLLPQEWLGGDEATTAELVPERLLAGKNWRGIGPYPLEGVPEILLAVGDCVREIPKPPPGRVLVMLPAADLDAAVDPRIYRTAIEVMVSRLEAAGVREVFVGPPIRYGAPEARSRMLVKAVQEALEGRGGRALDVEPFLREELWRLDPGTPGAYGRLPNEAGRKKIRQALADLIP